jgi:hypothetical protein
MLGYVENMSGYYCHGCREIRPLFLAAASTLPIPCLGTVPFDPELARHCDLGLPFADLHESAAGRALDDIARQLAERLGIQEHRP